jgi:hypothetical protein
VRALTQRTFVRLRQMMLDHRELADKIEELEQRSDSPFTAMFAAIRPLMTPPTESARRKLGFVRWDE